MIIKVISISRNGTSDSDACTGDSSAKSPIDKSLKNKVLFDNGQECFFSDEELFKHGIYEDKEYNEDDISSLIEEIKIGRAYAKGLNFIMFKKNSSKQLYDKLVGKGFSGYIAQAALVRLKEAGYIDDMRYAENYVKLAAANKYKTVSQVKKELLLKGIDADIIADAAARHFTEDSEDEINKIKQFINNKYYKLINDNDIEYNKLISIKRSLYNKGYTPDAINKAIEDIFLQR